MPHIERRQRLQVMIQRIDLLAITRAIVERLAIGVASQEFQSRDTLPQAQLQGVVTGITDGDEIAIAAESPAERSTSAVDGATSDRMIDAIFTTGAAHRIVRDLARLANAQTQRGISRVSLKRGQQVMSLRANIADGQQSCRSELPLNRKLILLGVGQNIFMIESRRGADGQEVCPIDRRPCSGQRDGETLAFDVSCAAINKRSYEFGRHRTAVERSKRRVSDFVEVRGAFKGAVKLSPSGADAGSSSPARQGLHDSAVPGGRIGQTDARGEIVVPGWCERARNARIAGENPSCGRTWETRRVQSGHERF